MSFKSTDPIELSIDSLSNSGDGVGRFENKVVFVPFALPGEKVLVQVTLHKKTFLKARLVEVIESSPDRVSPRCNVFGQCGGCDWQNLVYEKQLYWKKRNLIEVLKRVGKVSVDNVIEEVHPSPLQYNYRNRIQLQTGPNGPHYYAKNSQQPIFIEECPLASENINQWLKKNKASLPRRKSKIEIAETTEAKVATFAVDKLGRSQLGFRQVNDRQNEYIAEEINQHINREGLTQIVDLFCGQGNWSMALAAKSSLIECVGIDNNKINITKAKEKAPTNCRYSLGDALTLLQELPLWGDLIIVDPPRAGCSAEVLEQLCKSSPPWLIYISCHPASMARDLHHLVKGPWEIHRMIPVDMFPQTAHLECLTILRSANPAKTANC